MKNIFLLIVVVFFLFSCSSVQSAPEETEISSAEETADVTKTVEEAEERAKAPQQTRATRRRVDRPATTRPRQSAPYRRRPPRQRERPAPAEPAFEQQQAREETTPHQRTAIPTARPEPAIPPRTPAQPEVAAASEAVQERERLVLPLPPVPAPDVSQRAERAARPAERPSPQRQLPALTQREERAAPPQPTMPSRRPAQPEVAAASETVPPAERPSPQVQPPALPQREERTAPPAPAEEVAASETPSVAPEPNLAEEQDPSQEPSRLASLAAGQNLEVWYPGQGWVFSGFREGAAGGMAFASRRIEDRDTIFVFRSVRPGSYILDFSRFDVLTGSYIADALSVEVEPATPNTSAQSSLQPSIVRAPDYPGLRIGPQAPAAETSNSRVSSARQEPPVSALPGVPSPAEASVVPSASNLPQEEGQEGEFLQEPFIAESEELALDPAYTSSLSAIREMIEQGEIAQALAALEAADGDEALFLLGQAYEADGDNRDIRKALSAYETLTQNYPLSNFWQDANRRIRYIRRFYFDMR